MFLLTIDHTDLADWSSPGLTALPKALRMGMVGLMNSRTGVIPESGDPSDTEEAAYITLGSGSRAVGGDEGGAQSVSAENARLNHDVSVGLLGGALRSGGVLTAAVGAVGQARPSPHALALCMDPTGVVDVRADLAALPRLVREWRAAARRYLVVIDCPAGPEGMVQADATVGRVLDLAGSDPVVLASPSPSRSAEASGRELVPLVCLVAGRSGTVTSPTTRKTGVVANIDLAPALVAAFGLNSGGMATGRGLLAVEAPPGWLAAAERLGEEQGRLQSERAPLVRAYVAEQVLSWLAALAFLWGPAAWRRRRVPHAVFIGLLTIGLYPPLSLLLGLLGYHGAFADTVLGLSISLIAAAALNRATCHGAASRVMWMGALACAVVVADVLLGGPLAWRSPIGYSLVSGARYYGIGNEFMGVLIGSSLVALAARARLDSGARICRADVVLVGLAVTVALGAPWAGANLGGAMAAAAGYAYLAAAPGQWRASGVTNGGSRYAGMLLGLTIASVIVLVGLAAVAVDAIRPSGVQSHLGVLAVNVLRAGPAVMVPVLLRKLAMNLRLIRYTVWSRILLASFAAYVVLLFRPRGMVSSVLRGKPALRHGLSAATVSAMVALTVEDSGVVAAGMLMIYPGVALLTALLERSSPPSEPVAGLQEEDSPCRSDRPRSVAKSGGAAGLTQDYENCST